MLQCAHCIRTWKWLLLFLVVISYINNSCHSLALKVSVFGATGGVGQLICKRLISNGYSVKAISRDPTTAKGFENLNECKILKADARQLQSLTGDVIDSDIFIISVGTTAFPTKKWDNGNTPKVACVQTVENILDAIQKIKVSPKAVVLLSSIGVERTQSPPFNILNSFGILDAKLESENLLLQRCEALGSIGIVVRPGRLVGAPFTNFDLAKLLNVTQGENKGIVIDTRDVLSGDVERQDVAEVIVRLLQSIKSTSMTSTATTSSPTKKLPSFVPFVAPAQQRNIRFSIINKPGDVPTDSEWGKLLSLFTVPTADMLTTRSSD